MTAVLAAERLVRRYSTRAVVSDVSLALDAADSVALMGPSGCGKTTLLQILGLLDRPTEGRVVLSGEDAWRASDARRAELRLVRLGFVFQQNNLLDHLSVRENIALPAWRATGDRRAALARADEWLERFGLAARRAARAAELSVGEAQRAAIARALVNDPAIVLADEPTGSLDEDSARAVLDALFSCPSRGVALLVVTHDPNVAARAGRTIRMRDGKLS